VIVGGALILLYVAASYAATNVSASVSVSPDSESPATASPDRYRAKLRTFKSFFGSILPPEIQYETAADLWRAQFSQHHDLAAQLTASAKQPGSLVSLNVFCRLLNLVTLNVVAGLVLYRDAGTCSSRTEDEEDCLNMGPLSPLKAPCRWESGTGGTGGTCADGEAKLTYTAVIFAVLAVCVLAPVLDKLFAFLSAVGGVAVRQRRVHWLCCLCDHLGIESNNNTKNTSNSNNTTTRVMVAPSPIVGAVGGGPVSAQWHQSKAPPYTPHSNRGLGAVSMRGTQTGGRGTNITTPAAPSVHQMLSLEQGQGLEHFGDEWKSNSVQGKKTTMLRGARLATMKRSIDFVSADRELQLMLVHRERHFWMEALDRPYRTCNCFDALRGHFRAWQLGWFDFGDTDTALELMDLAHVYRESLVVGRLKRARARAVVVRVGVLREEDEYQQDAYLVRRFLADSLCGYKRVVAHSLFFEQQQEQRLMEHRVIWQYVSLAAVPAYLAVSLAVLGVGGLDWRPIASHMWIASTALSLLLHLFCSRPATIWFLNVWVPSLCKWDLLSLHWVLQTRARTVLGRRSGALMNVNALLQHFHPACRAARLLPHLSASRLLMSLSDYDLPVRQLLARPRKHSAKYSYPTVRVLDTGSPLVSDRCEALRYNAYSNWRWVFHVANLALFSLLRLSLHGLFLLPRWAREAAVEATAGAACCGLLLALAHLVFAGLGGLLAAAAVVLLLGLSVCVAIFKVRRGIRLENRHLQILSSQQRFRLGLSKEKSQKTLGSLGSRQRAFEAESKQ